MRPASQVVNTKPSTSNDIESINCHHGTVPGTPNGMRAIITMGELMGIILPQTATGPEGSLLAAVIIPIEKITSMDIEKTMREVDFSKMKADIEKAMKSIDLEKMKVDLNETIAKIDWEKMRKELEEIQKVDFSKIELEMKEAQEEMKKIQPMLEKELANVKVEMEKAKVEIEKAKVEMKEYKGFVDGLEKDGLINKKEEYTIKHEDGVLTINGKKASDQVYNKYKTFLEKHKKFNIEKTADDFDIDMD